MPTSHGGPLPPSWGCCPLCACALFWGVHGWSISTREACGCCSTLGGLHDTRCTGRCASGVNTPSPPLPRGGCPSLSPPPLRGGRLTSPLSTRSSWNEEALVRSVPSDRTLRSSCVFDVQLLVARGCIRWRLAGGLWSLCHPCHSRSARLWPATVM